MLESFYPPPKCSEVTFLGAVTASLISIPKCWHNRKTCSLIMGHHINHLKPMTSSPCHGRTSEHWYTVWQNKRNTTATEHRDSGSMALRDQQYFTEVLRPWQDSRGGGGQTPEQARSRASGCFPNTRMAFKKKNPTSLRQRVF